MIRLGNLKYNHFFNHRLIFNLRIVWLLYKYTKITSGLLSYIIRILYKCLWFHVFHAMSSIVFLWNAIQFLLANFYSPFIFYLSDSINEFVIKWSKKCWWKTPWFANMTLEIIKILQGLGWWDQQLLRVIIICKKPFCCVFEHLL